MTHQHQQQCEEEAQYWEELEMRVQEESGISEIMRLYREYTEVLCQSTQN